MHLSKMPIYWEDFLWRYYLCDGGAAAWASFNIRFGCKPNLK